MAKELIELAQHHKMNYKPPRVVFKVNNFS